MLLMKPLKPNMRYTKSLTPSPTVAKTRASAHLRGVLLKQRQTTIPEQEHRRERIRGKESTSEPVRSIAPLDSLIRRVGKQKASTSQP